MLVFYLKRLICKMNENKMEYKGHSTFTGVDMGGKTGNGVGGQFIFIRVSSEKLFVFFLQLTYTRHIGLYYLGAGYFSALTPCVCNGMKWIASYVHETRNETCSGWLCGYVYRAALILSAKRTDNHFKCGFLLLGSNNENVLFIFVSTCGVFDAVFRCCDSLRRLIWPQANALENINPF